MEDPKAEFAEGDRVRAKTGGPVMVVEAVYAPVFFYRYKCVWADPDGFPKHEMFKVNALERAPEEGAN
jgi:uncharacterized protein YodC (DUF2158 family)